MAASAPGPSLTYVYDGDLDWTGHRFGVSSSQWLQQLAMVDAEAEQLREALPAAPCGWSSSPTTAWSTRPPEGRIDVDEHPELRDGRGAGRRRGPVPPPLLPRAARSTTSSPPGARSLGDRAVVLTRDEAIERGWFGAVDPGVRPRLGDVVVACTGDTAVLSTSDFPYEAKLVGLHGSLTPAEMLIPVVVA